LFGDLAQTCPGKVPGDKARVSLVWLSGCGNFIFAAAGIPLKSIEKNHKEKLR
jgi:hypothetical protein